MKLIENKTFDAERALYQSSSLTVRNCRFEGPADGESALKESDNIIAENCYFDLRYPFWHDKGLFVADCVMTANCRAALWYSENVDIRGSKLHGIKALRECTGVRLSGCDIISPEFGWSVNDITMENCSAQSEYFLMRAGELTIRGLRLDGKYSFQYIKNAVFEDCVLNTKDAFWHAENVTVRNSAVNGEYLGWYSRGLTFENCKITGTQPLCWCRELKLINCEMTDADLSFEKSDVEARLTAPIVSIKNPRSGRITVPSVGEIIDDENTKCEIITG